MIEGQVVGTIAVASLLPRCGGGDMTSQVLAGLLLRGPFQPFRFIGLGKQ